MDISNLEVGDTALIELTHPATGERLLDDKGTPMTVEVYGQDSSAYKKVDKIITDRRLKRMSHQRNKFQLTSDEVEAETMERLVACVKSWHIVVEGKTPKCTAEQVEALFKKYPWIQDQVAEGVSDRANFLRG